MKGSEMRWKAVPQQLRTGQLPLAVRAATATATALACQRIDPQQLYARRAREQGLQKRRGCAFVSTKSVA